MYILMCMCLCLCPCLCSALSGCAHLRTLRLSACAVVGGRGLLRCPTLERLDLSECRLLRNLRGIQNCTSLASVTISECPVLNDISALSGCAALSQLHVTFCPMVVNLTSLSDCENLSFMKVTNCSSLRGSDLRQWTSLRKIHLVRVSPSFLFPCLPPEIHICIRRPPPAPASM